MKKGILIVNFLTISGFVRVGARSEVSGLMSGDAETWHEADETTFTVQEWESFNVMVVEVKRDECGNIVEE
ncbi:MAG: hypothetical protein PUP92_35920 [Rhizonema sp. PD38]|nr:hypothetical protein [Rhizonema sp. PD38]